MQWWDDIIHETKVEKQGKENVLYIFITFIPHDDHRDLQTVVTPPALRGTLSRTHFSLEDRLPQSDSFLEGLPTVHTEHHDEEVPCEIGYRVWAGRFAEQRIYIRYLFLEH